jgi:uncharacterized repeat protein (TIGR01451 family)
MSISRNVRVIFSLTVGGLLLVGLLLLLDGPSRIARADPGTLFVTTTGTGTACTPAQPCALREAVAQATDGDTLLVAQGTYTGTGAAVITITKNITLYGGWNGATGAGSLVLPGVYVTTLDGENARRAVFITGTVSPNLDGFTLRNGLASGDSGGAIYTYNASPVITNCRILDSTADRGGGVAFWYGAPVLGNSVVMGNAASGSQAGDGGGGLSLSNSSALLEGNTIQDNDASNAAGGGVSMLQSAVALEANTILGNQAKWAGGLEIAGSDPFTMTNNIVALNSSQDGAPVRVYGTYSQLACSGECPSQGTLLHNTFVTNTSSNTSWMISVGPTTTLTFANTIVGLPGGIRVEAGGSVTLDKTLWETGSALVSGYGTFLVRNSLYGDPAFLDPNGGDYHIGLASAAIDQGLDAGLDDDIDGDPRPQGDGYDIGADETGLVVTKDAEPDAVEPGEQLTYTIRVANTSGVNVNATITDTLPVSVTLGQTSGGSLVLPSGTVVTWTAVITEPGGVWMETLVVTVDVNYVGPLVNLVEVTTAEGAAGDASITVRAGGLLYLPVMMRDFS